MNIDTLLTEIWMVIGGQKFGGLEAWEHAPKRLRADMIDKIQGRGRATSIQIAASNMLGRQLTLAAANGYRNSEGLGVVKTSHGYSVVRIAPTLCRVDVHDLADLLQRAADLDTKLLSIHSEITIARALLGGIVAAADRDAGAGESQEETISRILVTIGIAYGDRWRSLRQLESIVGSTPAHKQRFLACVGGVIDGLRVEESRQAKTGWRVFRVLTV